MDISIIVPVYNVEKYLARCLESIVHYNKQSIEIIIINDGSTDDSYEICKGYEKKYNTVKLINQENKGLSATRNFGIRQAKGDYIIFLDSDDWLDIDLVDSVYKTLKRHELDMLVFSYRIINQDDREISRVKPYKAKESIVLSGTDYIEGYGKSYPTMVWSYIYSRKYLLKNSFFFKEGYYHEDCEYTSRVFPRAERIGFKDLVIYNHFFSEVSIMRSKNIKKCEDLIEISNMVHCNAEKIFEKSPVAAMEIHRYASYLSFAALKSCVIQGFEMGELIKDKSIRLKIMRNLDKNVRYLIPKLLLKFKMLKSLKVSIIILERIRTVLKGGIVWRS